MGEFAMGAASVFDHLDDALYTTPLTAAAGKRFIGFDPGKTRDPAAVVVMDLQRQVLYAKTYKHVDFPKQIRIIEALIREWNGEVWIDSQGYGYPLMDFFAKGEHASKIHGKPVSDRRMRSELIEALALDMDPFFSSPSVKIPYHKDHPCATYIEEMVQQLRAMDYRTTPRGEIVYESGVGMHDDLVIALWRREDSDMRPEDGKKKLSEISWRRSISKSEIEEYQHDPDSASALVDLKAEIIALPWVVVASSPDLALFVRQCLTRIWNQLVVAATEALEWGHSPMEITWELSSITVFGKRYPAAIVPSQVTPVLPKTVRYLLDESSRQVVGFRIIEHRGITEHKIDILDEKAMWYSHLESKVMEIDGRKIEATEYLLEKLQELRGKGITVIPTELHESGQRSLPARFVFQEFLLACNRRLVDWIVKLNWGPEEWAFISPANQGIDMDLVRDIIRTMLQFSAEDRKKISQFIDWITLFQALGIPPDIAAERKETAPAGVQVPGVVPTAMPTGSTILMPPTGSQMGPEEIPGRQEVVAPEAAGTQEETPEELVPEEE